MYLNLSQSLYLHIFVTLYLCTSVSTFLYLFISSSVSICRYASIFASLFLHLSLISLYFSISISLSLSLLYSNSIFLYFSTSVSVYPLSSTPCPFHYLSLSLLFYFFSDLREWTNIGCRWWPSLAFSPLTNSPAAFVGSETQTLHQVLASSPTLNWTAADVVCLPSLPTLGRLYFFLRVSVGVTHVQ